MLILDNNVNSTQPLYEMCYVIKTFHTTGYTNEPLPADFYPLEEQALTTMAALCAQNSLQEGWLIESQEESDYWDSFTVK